MNSVVQLILFTSLKPFGPEVQNELLAWVGSNSVPSLPIFPGK